MAKQDEWARITLRLPPELHEELSNSAWGRSLNAEIIERLSHYKKLVPLQPMLAFADAERKRLQENLDTANARITELEKLVRDFVGLSQEQIQEDEERIKQDGETEVVLRRAQEAIKRSVDEQKRMAEILLSFGKMFEKAAHGDESGLQHMVTVYKFQEAGKLDELAEQLGRPGTDPIIPPEVEEREYPLIDKEKD